MNKNLKIPWPIEIKVGSYILIGLIMSGLIGVLPLFDLKAWEVEADFEVLANQNLEPPSFPVIQGNALLPISSSLLPKGNFQIVDLIPGIVTAYSSTLCQTDETPHLTAAGTWVRDGVVANNVLPFGTKVRFPEVFGNKIFIVEDRMHWRKGNSQFDIWMDSYEQAKNFGVKRTYIEILEI